MIVAWIWSGIWYVLLDPIKWVLCWALNEDGFRDMVSWRKEKKRSLERASKEESGEAFQVGLFSLLPRLGLPAGCPALAMCGFRFAWCPWVGWKGLRPSTEGSGFAVMARHTRSLTHSLTLLSPDSSLPQGPAGFAPATYANPLGRASMSKPVAAVLDRKSAALVPINRQSMVSGGPLVRNWGMIAGSGGTGVPTC